MVPPCETQVRAVRDSGFRTLSMIRARKRRGPIARRAVFGPPAGLVRADGQSRRCKSATAAEARAGVLGGRWAGTMGGAGDDHRRGWAWWPLVTPRPCRSAEKMCEKQPDPCAPV